MQVHAEVLLDFDLLDDPVGDPASQGKIELLCSLVVSVPSSALPYTAIEDSVLRDCDDPEEDGKGGSMLEDLVLGAAMLSVAKIDLAM